MDFLNRGAAKMTLSFDLKEIPFDQYQRYEISKRIIQEYKKFSGEKAIKILDVGGYFKNKYGEDWLPLLNFFPEDETVVLDVVDCSLDHYVKGNGRNLPFPEESFDVVITNDTLEHVFPNMRETFIKELLRVAKKELIITAPFYSEINQMFENILYEFIVKVLHGEHHMLQEHLVNGTPKIEDIQNILGDLGKKHFIFSSGNSYNWFLMMVMKHYFMSIPETAKLEMLIDRYYNENLFNEDQNNLPAYRKVIVISKEVDDEFVDHLKNSKFNSEEKGNNSILNNNVFNLTQTILQLINIRKQNEKHSKLVVWNTENHAPTPRINQKMEVGQSFLCPQDLFYKVSLLVGTYSQRIQGRLIFKLTDLASNEVKYQESIDLSKVEDNNWLDIEFPPIFGSENKMYEISMSSPKIEKDNGLSIWYSSKINNNSNLYFNDQKVDGMLCLKVYAREYNVADKYQFMYEQKQKENDKLTQYVSKLNVNILEKENTINELLNKVSSLEELVTNKENRINELIMEKNEQDKRISKLMENFSKIEMDVALLEKMNEELKVDFDRKLDLIYKALS